jgi:hypothetical protein
MTKESKTVTVSFTLSGDVLRYFENNVVFVCELIEKDYKERLKEESKNSNQSSSNK